MRFHNVEQNSEEWYELRGGKITGSALCKAMANYGKAFGEPAKKYAVSIALEQITGNAQPSGYSNEHMERGHEEEHLARMAYEEEYFAEVTNGGFFELDGIGCSPDGLVGEDGVIEIKSAIPSIHYARIKNQSFDSAYKWQLIGNMKMTGREWIDFISYCSGFPIGRQLYVYRLQASDYQKEYKMIDARIGEFKALIETVKNDILNCNYSIIEGK